MREAEFRAWLEAQDYNEHAQHSEHRREYFEPARPLLADGNCDDQQQNHGYDDGRENNRRHVE